MEHVLELALLLLVRDINLATEDKEDKWLTVTDCVATALEWTLLISWCSKM